MLNHDALSSREPATVTARASDPSGRTLWRLLRRPLPFVNSTCEPSDVHTGDAESMAKYYDDLKAKTLLALAREDGLIGTQDGQMDEFW